MQYAGQLAQIQQAASRTEDYAARRAATFRELSATTGEAVLEIGCGSGLFAREIAEAVGAAGQVCAIDVSTEQVEAARVNCAGLSNVELRVGSALALPYADDVFDAVASIQVVEYIADVPAALAEMHRVLKPGGRLVNFATNWGALFWNSRQPARTQEVLKAWHEHAPHPNLPAVLRALLADAGFSGIHQSAVSILNTTYDTATYSYWLARLIAAFAVERQLLAPDATEQWLEDLADAARCNKYLFCSIAVVTRALR
jgi:ubiquinone/menaquinone biosynthesis C-methylase UbiE